ncbi:MAG: RNA-guided endonuclease TnpB family protein [bacterium]|nr:RNA-guided endonuclease TnpB family protein [bacterium]
MIRSHRIRLNPTPEQAEYFVRAAGTRRFVFNWGLAEWKRQYEAGEKPSALALKKQFNAIKGEQFPWVYEVTKCAVEGAFMDLATAFKNFFEGRKLGRKVGYPKFKTKKRSREGFYVANDKFDVSGHWIKLPHIGLVNMAEKLRFQGKILSARITCTVDWWFVSIAVEIPDVHQQQLPGKIGIDLGLNHLATLSDGSELENQKPLRSLLSQVKRLSRSLSRKQKGSKNREKARRKLARLHYRITCIRDDLLHKVTTHIAQTYGFVAVESLHVKGMMQNHALAQALGDAAFGRFTELLATKVSTAQGKVVQVGRFYPSSKTCSCCGHVKADLSLSERVFVCPACGFTLDRDHNAAINILHEALRLSASSQ